MEIKNTTPLNDLFKHFPALEQAICERLPELDNLKQHALKEAVLNITNIEHIALRANIDVHELVMTLRNEAGLEVAPVHTASNEVSYLADDPGWVKIAPRHHIDGVEMLSRGEHPLERISNLLEEMGSGENLLLTTNFYPQPMVENMTGKGYRVHSRNDINNQSLHLTFIGKQH